LGVAPQYDKVPRTSATQPAGLSGVRVMRSLHAARGALVEMTIGEDGRDDRKGALVEMTGRGLGQDTKNGGRGTVTVWE